MKTLPRISETEWEIMRVLWARHPLAAGEIIDALQARDRTWHPKTAKTLLSRLVKKGALGFTRQGRAYLYRPRVAEADCLTAVSESFLERLFGGSLTPMLAHLVEQKRLSPRELAELKQVLKGR